MTSTTEAEYVDAHGDTCEGNPHFQCERCGETFDAREEEKAVVSEGWELCSECYRLWMSGQR